MRHGDLRRELREGELGERVAVDADQQSRRPQPLGHQPRMARAAQRAVDGDLARLRVERLDHLPGEDRDVGTRHVKQDGQVMR